MPMQTLLVMPIRTQKEMREFCQAVIAKHRVGDTVSSADQANLITIFERHPHWTEKLGAGIDHITVERNVYKKHGFVLYRIDGTSDDISFVKCIENRTDTQKVIECFRRAVLHDIIEMKEKAFASGTVTCELTGVPLSWNECHVDHVHPYEFRALLDAWLDDNKLTLESFIVIDKDFAPQHNLLKLDWQEYHRKHAVLRIVSIQAHFDIHKRGTNVRGTTTTTP